MEIRQIIEVILRHYPGVEAIYMFGSYGTEDEWPDSDVDIAVLLPPDEARHAKMMAMGECWSELAALLTKDVDLINLRRVGTVFQMQIVRADRRVYCANESAADAFEMLVISLYQKLNEERAELLEAFHRTGRAYDV